jgi:2-oxoglutarate dehydrogenase E2 component (dihydrolipoamide succinyltransferase)
MRSDAEKQCPVCDAIYPARARFCHKDGTALSPLPSATAAQVGAPAGTGSFARATAQLKTGELAPWALDPPAPLTGPGPLAHLSARDRIDALPAAGPSSLVISIAVAMLLTGLVLMGWVFYMAFAPPVQRPAPPAATETRPPEEPAETGGAATAPVEGPAVPAAPDVPPVPTEPEPAPPPSLAPAATPPRSAAPPRRAAPRRRVESAKEREERLERAEKARKEREKAAKKARERRRRS